MRFLFFQELHHPVECPAILDIGVTGFFQLNLGKAASSSGSAIDDNSPVFGAKFADAISNFSQWNVLGLRKVSGLKLPNCPHIDDQSSAGETVHSVGRGRVEADKKKPNKNHSQIFRNLFVHRQSGFHLIHLK